MEIVELVKKFLKVEFPDSEKDFTDKDIEFLKRFKIENETESSILKSEGFLGKNFISVDNYYTENKHVRKAKERLQELRNIYRDRTKKDPKAFDDFASFLDWWYDQVDEKGNRKCYYCGIDEKTAKEAFGAAAKGKISLLETKKTAWKNGSMQIDRMAPKGDYSAKNCVFACVLCNNAKSDLITDEDFRFYFGESMKRYWEHIRKELEKTEQ